MDWLTDPENMELNDHIEKVNRKMFVKIQQSSEYVAVFFCKCLAQFCAVPLADKFSLQTARIASSVPECWPRSSTSTTRLTAPASILSKSTTGRWPRSTAFSHCRPCSSLNSDRKTPSSMLVQFANSIFAFFRIAIFKGTFTTRRRFSSG